MDEQLDKRDEPAWIGRMRAKGFKFRPSTGTPGLPVEPEISFDDPELTRRPSVWERAARFGRGMMKVLPGTHRRSRDGSHATVP
jgi:hypothetical protein